MYDLSQISQGVCVRAPRIILLGVEKIGKSTFAAGADNPIFLPIKGEEGIDDLDVAKTPTCRSLEEVTGWLHAIQNQENDRQTIVIDSVSALDPLVHDYVCREKKVESIDDVGGGYGKGYTAAVEVWRGVTAWLDALRAAKNMASILIGHVKIRRFDDPNGDSYDQYQLDAHEKVANLLFRWADCILFCNTKVVVKKTDAGFGKTKQQGIDVQPNHRFLYTQKRPAHPGGGRGVYGKLQYELPLSWEAFRDAVAAAM
jgi:hypothetical protein